MEKMSSDEIVITGMAGRFPECDSFDEFKNALLESVDMVTVDSRRWEPGTYDLPERTGKINNIEYFDAGYFGISPRMTDMMDPRHRVMFETAYEAIVDAGYNPEELRGSKTGVYVGLGGLDNMQAYKDVEETSGYSIIGCTLCQIANRTSYSFDLKGPSFTLDTACSSGLYAFANAVKAMERGDIDAAIVSAVSINMHPHESREFLSLNMLSPEGKCKVFAVDRDGYARSEAIVTVLLQKKSACRRLYSTVLGAEMNCDGYKLEGITFPSSKEQLELMSSLYQSKNLDPNEVAWVEMHGTGTPVGDIVECQSVVDMFCSERKEPMLVGAVKSNMGHSEISSGLCSLAKVLVAMETNIIPANLHCENIDYTLPGIIDGKLKVIDTNTPWKGGVVSINCFGFGGANAHVILNSNKLPKLKPKRNRHRLVQVSGRTEESVKHYLQELQKYQDDQELLALVDEIHKMDVNGHVYRGYAVLGDNPIQEIKKYQKERRPIWFIYTGMGCQWTGQCKDLMKLDIFKNTIERCAKAMEPYGVDIIHLITADDPSIFDDITNCFCAITAAEIALTDVLKSFGVEPDGFAGHSLGEVGCAYCNGDITPEQAMLLGYARGYGMKQSKCEAGQMAAIGMSKEEITPLLPKHVFVACVNGKNSVTITGLQKSVDDFVATLSSQGVFAKLVQTAGYAFHSEYIQPAVPHMEGFISKVLTNPQPRSEKWVSSSRLQSDWNEPSAKLNCAEYHRNNFRRPVLFDQVLERIPKNAVLIEIAPHGLLTSLLKRELGSDVTCLSLNSKTSKDNLQFMFSNIGKLFVNGGQPNLRKFYPEVNFPVGRGTPSTGSIVKWDHSVKWFTPFFESNKSFGKKITVNTSQDKYAYLKGHFIDGRILMPATGYLELVWKVYAESNTKKPEQLPISFESVKFMRATVLPDNEDITFFINIMKQSGYFEIFEGGSVCCSGTVRSPENISGEFVNLEVNELSSQNGTKLLMKPDVYKFFHLKRYTYGGLFQGIEKVDLNGSVAELRWDGRFTSFLDTMFQIPLVNNYSTDLQLPSRLQKLLIDPVKHLEEANSEQKTIVAYHDKYTKTIKTSAIELTNLEVFPAPKRQKTQADPVLEKHIFVPYINESSQDVKNFDMSVTIALQIVGENNGLVRVLNVYEALTKEENSIRSLMENICKKEPMINIVFADSDDAKVDLIVCPDGHYNNLQLKNLNDNGFVLYYGTEENIKTFNLTTIYQNSFNGKGVYLLRSTLPSTQHKIVNISNHNDFKWIDEVKQYMEQSTTIYLSNGSDDMSGVLGLVKCLNLEPLEKASIKCIFSKNTVDQKQLQQQIDKNLTINVFRNGVWGSYRHIPINIVNDIEVTNACNYIQTIGDLSSFRWVEQLSPSSSNVVYIHYAALNFKDVMVATGKILLDEADPCGPEVVAGFEYSGVTSSSRRIMGMTNSSIALQVVPDPLFSWEIPKEWSLKEAATIPVVYATCLYGLIIRGQLQHGESILIHAGAGGIGIAAISIAMSMNCTIFTTVGSEEKKEFLLKLFPKLKPENIGSSRDASFEQMVMRNTKGRGVDQVLNSLSANLFQASIRCVARRGRFIEIGKVDLWAGTPVSASLFSKNTSFHGVLLDDLFDIEDESPVKRDVNRLLTEGIAKGFVKPLPATVFKEDQIEEAYRFLSTGKHKGKVLIEIRNEERGKSLERTIKALPRIYFHRDKSYVLAGGLGGFGLELTDFLISRGAKHIILNSRRGISNGYQSLCIKKWASRVSDVTIDISTDDTSTKQGAESLVKFAERIAPIGGIFNMALVLEDALFINQTAKKFESVFNSKIYSGFNLDAVSRARCPKLDHFVVFSSFASGRGNAGQSNYGMANSALERLCEQRREDGLPGLSVQYGPIADVGAVAENVTNLEQAIRVIGLDFQKITSCINVLETFMLQPYAVGSSFVINEGMSSSSDNSKKTPIEMVANILGVKDIAHVEKNQCLGDLGLDSLMSAEIKQTLYRNFNVDLDVATIRDLTFNKIDQMFEKSDPSKNTSCKSSKQQINGHSDIIDAMLSKEETIQFENSSSNKLFFLPPIEGNIKCMSPLAKLMKSNVYGLQFTKHIEADEMKSYAQHFVKVIREIQPNGPYVLCGYSYGASLGFEISVLLQKLKENAKLFLIDGTPNFVKSILEAQFRKLGQSTQSSDSAILKAFLKTFQTIPNEKIDTIFDDSMDLQEKLSRVSHLVKEYSSYSNDDDIITAAESYLKRIKAGFYYKPSSNFTGDVTLIRSDCSPIELSKDYDLQQFCENPVRIQILNGDHKKIIQGDNLTKIAGLINSNL